ncbi:hypothetical protein P278_16280 [Zhouia amylolytica AD3]|uniref:Uncharacterized protein n=1 Tax=Zhouia amylolytica AD3 TaxID=1286632 RepID=W2UP18_9FLAO|nr:hypothetical protein P278_16280 [Zhouia amylolytica AD3]
MDSLFEVFTVDREFSGSKIIDLYDETLIFHFFDSHYSISL